MHIEVRDDGRGLPEPLEEGLGLQIVRSLVEQDLRGDLNLVPSDTGGCTARIRVPMG
jgi:two-component sensor histidine kinase